MKRMLSPSLRGCHRLFSIEVISLFLEDPDLQRFRFSDLRDCLCPTKWEGRALSPSWHALPRIVHYEKIRSPPFVSVVCFPFSIIPIRHHRYVGHSRLCRLISSPVLLVRVPL